MESLTKVETNTRRFPMSLSLAKELYEARKDGLQVFRQRQYENPGLRRSYLLWGLQDCDGRSLQNWKPENFLRADRKKLVPLSSRLHKIYPFSNQEATFNKLISDLWQYVAPKKICNSLRRRANVQNFRYRLRAGRDFLLEGATLGQRALGPMTIFFEILLPAMWLLCFVLALVIRLVLKTGVRFPLLPFTYFFVWKSGICGMESLSDGENGYTRVFQGGEEIDLQELEKELMKKNELSPDEPQDVGVCVISISYKHFANKGIVPGDDHRISRTDLQAIAALIKASSKCKLRLWIDSKLPCTTDCSFMRWMRRGVTPYGRYITFLCPSAQQYADASFWLSNEFYIASAAKGALYFIGDDI